MHPFVLHSIQISCSLKSKIIEGQKTDKGIFHIKEKIKEEPSKHFRVDEQDVLWFDDRLVVPKDRELKNKLMDEAHLSKLFIHPGSSKMYQELRPRYWWTKMKKEIAAYVARCDTCCRVKAIYMRPAGFLQPLSVPSWKWNDISMDFITGLPTTLKGHDLIWVIVDRLTKTAHFLPVKTDYRPPQYIEKYIAEIVRLHSIPKTIVSDRGSQFTAHFWEHLHKGLETSLIRSTAYHLQTNGQTKRVNAVLEDMLRACVLSSRGSWESWLPLAKFAYNNSYRESIKMAPFEALYGRKCRTPLNWIEPGERRYYGIDFVEEAEKKVHIIQQNMKAAQSC
jgi:hypothetical protein